MAGEKFGPLGMFKRSEYEVMDELHYYQPREDITVYELAQICGFSSWFNGDTAINGLAWMGLDKNLQRHFKTRVELDEECHARED
jgi:hypothetical protein